MPVFQEGVHYKQVLSPVKLLDSEKIRVEEIFWYGCPHCYQLESEMSAWLSSKPEDVDFRRLPHNLGRTAGEMHALAYHMAEKLGIVDKIHHAMFSAIQDRHLAMDSVTAICDLFMNTGDVTEERCTAAASSEEVQRALQRTEFLIQRYGISSVPVLVVDGRYYTSPSLTRKTSEVLNFLIEKQRVARKSPRPAPIAEPAPDGLEAQPSKPDSP